MISNYFLFINNRIKILFFPNSLEFILIFWFIFLILYGVGTFLLSHFFFICFFGFLKKFFNYFILFVNFHSTRQNCICSQEIFFKKMSLPESKDCFNIILINFHRSQSFFDCLIIFLHLYKCKH